MTEVLAFVSQHQLAIKIVAGVLLLAAGALKIMQHYRLQKRGERKKKAL